VPDDAELNVERSLTTRELIHATRNSIAALMLEIRGLKRIEEAQDRNEAIDSISTDIAELNRRVEVLIERIPTR
jgi:hypothetical protein